MGSVMQTKTCERCHEEKSIVFFRGRAGFMMPWCRACRALDPVGAKRVNDRLRQAQLDEEKLRLKNEQRKVRAREIRAEIRGAQSKADDLALAALDAIDISSYEGREKEEIVRELKRIKDIVRALKR